MKSKNRGYNVKSKNLLWVGLVVGAYFLIKGGLGKGGMVLQPPPELPPEPPPEGPATTIYWEWPGFSVGWRTDLESAGYDIPPTAKPMEGWAPAYQQILVLGRIEFPTTP